MTKEEFEKRLLSLKNLYCVVVSGYKIKFVPEKYMYRSFGYYIGEKIFVREELKPRVKDFVIQHVSC